MGPAGRASLGLEALPARQRARPRPRSVAVAMATYNGAEFLPAQLASIAAQTRAPDELVVCDDGSVDATVKIVEQFAAEAPFEVRLFRNSQRLGYGENFMKAGRACRSDVIAWSDQDDLWMPAKLARCMDEFERDPELLLVVHSTQIGLGPQTSDHRIAGALSRYHAWDDEEQILRRRSRYTPDALPLEVSFWGHSCVASRRVLELGDELAQLLPGLVSEFSGHDTWTGFLATSIGNVALLPDVLVHYRQHESQFSGATAPRTLATRAKQSAQRSDSRALEGIRAQATRAFFRAALLTQVAAQLDRRAGFGESARAFRTALDQQVADLQEVGSADGPSLRQRLWRRHGEILQRRLGLWQQPPASRIAAMMLVRNLARGDYGRSVCGGLGFKLLAADLWRVAGVRSAR